MGIVVTRAASSLRAGLPHLLQTSRIASRQFSAGPIPPLGIKLANSFLDLNSVITTHNLENTRNNTSKRPQFGYLVGAIVAAIVSGLAAWFFSTVKSWSLFPTGAAEESSSEALPASEAEKKLSLDSKPWYQAIREGIAKEEYQYSSPQIASDIDDLRDDIEEKVDEAQDKFLESHPETALPQIFYDPLLSMEGVALLAAYLREKKGVDNLFVCKSLEAFQAKLNEISRLEGNTRQALIMTLWPEQEDEHDKKDGEYGTNIHHKIAVGVEKKDGQISIAILDSLGVYNDEISPDRTLSAAKDLKYAEIKGSTNPLWYVYHSALNMQQTSVYYSKAKRQKTFNGCETFALSDGVAFLKDPHFFENIRTKKLLIKEGRAELILYKITLLPPRFMRGTQSLKLLTKYYEKAESFQDIEALKSKVDKHLVKVSGDTEDSIDIDATSLIKLFIKYYEKAENRQDIEALKGNVEQHLMRGNTEDQTSADWKLQNHLMNQKSIKYHLIVAAALENLPEEELQSLICKTLLTVPRLPLATDEDPRTLSDIHLCRSEIVIEQLKL